MQAFQRNSSTEFYALLVQLERNELSETYQAVLQQQQDCLFLCDLLLNRLTEQLSQQYPAIMRENASYLMLFSIVLLCLLPVTALFSSTFSRDLYQPVQPLVNRARASRQGDL